MPRDPLAGLLEDTKQATRCLRRRAGSSLSIVCVIALAIAVNSTVFSAVSAVLLGSSPYPRPDRLVRLWFGNQDSQARRALPRDLARWAASGEAFEHIAAYRPGVRPSPLTSTAAALCRSPKCQPRCSTSSVSIRSTAAPSCGRMKQPRADRLSFCGKAPGTPERDRLATAT
jgi:hypothetical protein